MRVTDSNGEERVLDHTMRLGCAGCDWYAGEFPSDKNSMGCVSHDPILEAAVRITKIHVLLNEHSGCKATLRNAKREVVSIMELPAEMANSNEAESAEHYITRLS